LLIIAYLLLTYVNYFVLIPKYLISHKYKQYLLILAGSVILLICFNLFIEKSIRDVLGLGHRIQDYTNPLILIDSLSTSMITIVCVGSMSMVTLFRLKQRQQHDVNELEINLLQSQLNKLKGQLSPTLLSRTLKHASSMVKVEGEKSSQILILVAKLLRYQLYDCSKERVFLLTEAQFITNLLDLNQQLNPKTFIYDLQIGDYLQAKKIVPLVLAMFPQLILEAGKISDIRIQISLDQDELFFNCAIIGEIDLRVLDFYMLIEKLTLHYSNDFKLSVDDQQVSLNLRLK